MTAGYGDIDWAAGLRRPPGDDDGYGYVGDVTHFVLRQSWLSNMDLCGGRVGLVMYAPAREPSEAMFAGTAMHFLIDNFIDRWLAHEDLAVFNDVEWIEQYIVSVALQKEGMDLMSKFPSARHMRQWITELMFMLNSWVEDWLLVRDNASVVEQAVGRENRLYMPVGTVKRPGTREPIKVWVSGHPDLYTGDVLIDWKTSSKNWRKGKAYGMSQDDVYAALVEYNDGLKLRESIFVVGDRNSRGWHEHHARMTEASIEAARLRAWTHARDLILETWSYTPTGSFGTRHWPCRPEYCSAWDVCQAKAIGDEYDSVAMITREQWL